ncbi:MAG: hypothetical protein P1U63_02635 [Coxiellaceae bacterium]|nr:hypothetical protein [Coxiellaceae bacterium]
MSKQLSIQSHCGEYFVDFYNSIHLDPLFDDVQKHYIVDRHVSELYSDSLNEILKSDSVLLIDATEVSKSLEIFPTYVEHLIGKKLRRNHRLIAIGGGIIQDITCFLAATMLRGVEWWFYPTTLLAQSDSCIGSKSSINCGTAKNILGTFTPPHSIFICAEFLNTLAEVDLHSGIGEMLKVHAISGPGDFEKIAKDYHSIKQSSEVMLDYIERSLLIKKAIIEKDEFDKGPRNVMNYGHTFGHAIESATNYTIPHGIAVTIGMDMANYVSAEYGYGKQNDYLRMHNSLDVNYKDYKGHIIDLDSFMLAISKDKKNLDSQLGLILPDLAGIPQRVYVENDEKFVETCSEYFTEVFQ